MNFRCCNHPKRNCCTDKDCHQGQVCCTKYQPPQKCAPCIDTTGVEGCLDPPEIHCVKSEGCQPCQASLDPTGEYNGCLDPTGVYCVPKKEQCNQCLDPTGVYGCLDPTGVYCIPMDGRGKRSIQYLMDQFTPQVQRKLDPTGIYRYVLSDL